MDANGETTSFPVTLLESIQLKQPIKTGCLEFQVYIDGSSQLVCNTPGNPECPIRKINP